MQVSGTLCLWEELPHMTHCGLALSLSHSPLTEHAGTLQGKVPQSCTGVGEEEEAVGTLGNLQEIAHLGHCRDFLAQLFGFKETREIVQFSPRQWGIYSNPILSPEYQTCKAWGTEC